MKRGLRLPSGRVIAIGRYILAALLLLILWFDSRNSAVPLGTFALVSVYLAFAVALLFATWKSWWLDALLAGPAHGTDIFVFTLLVGSTGGSTRLHLTFFMFVLLAAAVRWGWRAAGLTAVLLTLLYVFMAVVLAALNGPVRLDQFAVPTGQLTIFAIILLWFGVNQWRSGLLAFDRESFADPVSDESPLETSLRAAMDALDASTGVLIWREQGNREADAFIARQGTLSVTRIKGATFGSGTTPFLYDLTQDRALTRDCLRNLRSFSASELIRPSDAKDLHLREGLAIPFKTGAGEGELFVEDLPHLSTDHIELGAAIALDVVAHIERHALIIAVEESAEARSRLALARDLHDSVVQFLAGAAFRLEALKRDQSAGRNLEPELNHLKQLMLQEQGELRSFIAALRSAPQIGLDRLATDLQALSARLAQQWDVFCEFSAETKDMMVPTRLHLDAQHLIREAVANAVRHAGAKNVSIKLRAEAEKLRLDFINDGERYPKSPLTGEMPRSLSERVKLAGGVLELSRGMGVTRISVSLPIGGRVH